MKRILSSSPKLLTLIEIGVMIFLIFCLSLQSSRIEKLETSLLILKDKAYRMEQRQNALAAELQFKTDPAQIDANQRAWFDGLIRNHPDQVRGVDGKLAKER